MGLGRRPSATQNELWTDTRDIATAPGHPFDDRLNQLFRDALFDDFVEDLCEPYDVKGGRSSIPPGTDFRMVLIDDFEGIDSQRQTAGRCRDSLTLRQFLGDPLHEARPQAGFAAAGINISFHRTLTFARGEIEKVSRPITPDGGYGNCREISEE